MQIIGMFGVAALVAGCSSGITSPGPARSTGEFERGLNSLREQYHVPGMSAIVDGPGGVIWERGFGLANVATGDSVTPSTLFHLASLTKPFAAVIAMQLEQEGVLDLNAPVSRFGITLNASDTVRVWHLLSHTSELNPVGTVYHYSGNRFGLIDSAFVRLTGQSFAQLYAKRIAAVLSLENTAPNPRATAATQSIGMDASAFAARLARGYSYDAKAGVTLVNYESYFGSAAGLISTPRDMVRFSRALDEGLLISAASRARMWTPVHTPAGRTLPYALGWFVQQYHGETIMWHYGLWTGASALIIKVPSRRLTFVALANSPGISMPFPLGNGDVTTSPFARLFLESFVDGGLH